jgi:hypothetical protein
MNSFRIELPSSKILLIATILLISLSSFLTISHGNRIKAFVVSTSQRMMFEILGPPTYQPDQAVITVIPKQTDWINNGIVLTEGTSGSWDVRLHGMYSPCAALKKDGTYFLYYIGADGDRSTDGGPRHRALGVATSSDGINFTKYGGNPIITYLPHNNEEEGVFSCGATLDDTGNVVLYYGALRAPNSTSGSVDIDIRMQNSSDGLSFTGDTLIRQVSGSELTPIGTIHYQDSWYVYYRGPLGGGVGPLQLLSGDSPDNLPNNALVLSSKGAGGDPIWLDSENIALFLLKNFNQGGTIEVRIAPASSPEQVSAPIEEYDFGSDWRHQTVLFDSETDTWFMYHRPTKGNEIYVRTASSTTPIPPGYDECVFLPSIRR